MNTGNKSCSTIRKFKPLIIKFLKFAITSGTSCIIDLGLFQLISFLLKRIGVNLGVEVWFATIVARVLSSLYNYFMNKVIVFNDQQREKNSIVRYYILCICQMCVSALLVWLLCTIIVLPEIIIKILVDVALFLISFQIQRLWFWRKSWIILLMPGTSRHGVRFVWW